MAKTQEIERIGYYLTENGKDEKAFSVLIIASVLISCAGDKLGTTLKIRRQREIRMGYMDVVRCLHIDL